MNGKIKKINLSILVGILIVLSIETQLLASEVLGVNVEQIAHEVETDQYPRVPVKFSDPQTNIVKHDIEVSVLSEKKIQQVFNEIKKAKSRLQYDVYSAGCESRALEIAIMLDKMSIKSIKVFVDGPLYFRGEKWHYHVAPVLFVLKKGKIEAFVIDPTVDEQRPRPLSSWRSAIGVDFFEVNTFTNQYVHLPAQKDLDLKDYRPEDLDKKDGDLKLLKALPSGERSWLTKWL